MENNYELENDLLDDEDIDHEYIAIYDDEYATCNLGYYPTQKEIDDLPF